MIVQNVMVTLEVALLVFLAFALRRNRNVHGALLLSTALLFMGIAMFFTLISHVPGYRAGPGAGPRIADAAQANAWKRSRRTVTSLERKSERESA